MKYKLTFAPANFPKARTYTREVETDEDDCLCGEKEKIAQELEEYFGVPFRCVEVEGVTQSGGVKAAPVQTSLFRR